MVETVLLLSLVVAGGGGSNSCLANGCSGITSCSRLEAPPRDDDEPLVRPLVGGGTWSFLRPTWPGAVEDRRGFLVAVVGGVEPPLGVICWAVGGGVSEDSDECREVGVGLEADFLAARLLYWTSLWTRCEGGREEEEGGGLVKGAEGGVVLMLTSLGMVRGVLLLMDFSLAPL